MSDAVIVARRLRSYDLESPRRTSGGCEGRARLGLRWPDHTLGSRQLSVSDAKGPVKQLRRCHGR